MEIVLLVRSEDERYIELLVQNVVKHVLKVSFIKHVIVSDNLDSITLKHFDILGSNIIKTHGNFELQKITISQLIESENYLVIDGLPVKDLPTFTFGEKTGIQLSKDKTQDYEITETMLNRQLRTIYYMQGKTNTYRKRKMLDLIVEYPFYDSYINRGATANSLYYTYILEDGKYLSDHVPMIISTKNSDLFHFNIYPFVEYLGDPDNLRYLLKGREDKLKTISQKNITTSNKIILILILILLLAVFFLGVISYSKRK